MTLLSLRRDVPDEVRRVKDSETARGRNAHSRGSFALASGIVSSIERLRSNEPLRRAARPLPEIADRKDPVRLGGALPRSSEDGREPKLTCMGVEAGRDDRRLEGARVFIELLRRVIIRMMVPLKLDERPAEASGALRSGEARRFRMLRDPVVLVSTLTKRERNRERQADRERNRERERERGRERERERERGRWGVLSVDRGCDQHSVHPRRRAVWGVGVNKTLEAPRRKQTLQAPRREH